MPIPEKSSRPSQGTAIDKRNTGELQHSFSTLLSHPRIQQLQARLSRQPGLELGTCRQEQLGATPSLQNETLPPAGGEWDDVWKGLHVATMGTALYRSLFLSLF